MVAPALGSCGVAAVESARGNTGGAQDIRDRAPRDGVAEVLARADEVRVAPAWVVASQTEDPFVNRLGQRRPFGCRFPSRLGSPRYEPAVPGEDGVRRGDRGHVVEEPASEPLAVDGEGFRRWQSVSFTRRVPRVSRSMRFSSFWYATESSWLRSNQAARARSLSLMGWRGSGIGAGPSVGFRSGRCFVETARSILRPAMSADEQRPLVPRAWEVRFFIVTLQWRETRT